MASKHTRVERGARPEEGASQHGKNNRGRHGLRVLAARAVPAALLSPRGAQDRRLIVAAGLPLAVFWRGSLEYLSRLVGEPEVAQWSHAETADFPGANGSLPPGVSMADLLIIGERCLVSAMQTPAGAGVKQAFRAGGWGDLGVSIAAARFLRELDPRAS